MYERTYTRLDKTVHYAYLGVLRTHIQACRLTLGTK